MEQTMNYRTRARGFTLIELMIVVAIVAVLALIAYPSYTRQVQKSRRAQAKADLVELAQGLEREFTANRSYAGYTLAFADSPRDTGATVAYNIVLGNLTATTYTLTANATGPQATDLCGNLTLTNTGVKTHSAGDEATCNWGGAPGP
jgi:type IV pilus assembly protein PilE